MGCNCKKGRVLQEVPKPEPTPEPIPQPQEDWYNNIDEITPLSGQTQN
jgi:hypothetical protein